MAGGNESSDNPLPINVVPMVDIIFCLCVFFLCAFQVHAIESRFETWLPKDKGNDGGDAGPLRELRVLLAWDESRQQLTRQFLQRVVKDDAELEALLREAHDELVARNQPEVPLILDAGANVPWKDAMAVVDLGKSLDIANLQFALGLPDAHPR